MKLGASDSNTFSSSGSSGDSEIIGDEKRDKLTGTNGDDYIDGRGGNDYINALDGDDIIIGGKGRNTIVTGDGKDMIVMSKKTGKGIKNRDFLEDFTKGKHYLLIQDKRKKKYEFDNHKNAHTCGIRRI